MAVVAASILGFPLGFVIGMHEFRAKHWLIHGLNALLALPTVVVGLVLYGLFTRPGPLGSLGLLYTPWAMVIGLTVLVIPIIAHMTIAAISSADPRLQMTCRSLGANTLQEAAICFHELRFALMAGVIMAFGRAIGEVGIAMMLGGNIAGQTRTMTTAIALQTSKGEFELGMALGIVLLIVAFFVNILMLRLQVKRQ